MQQLDNSRDTPDVLKERWWRHDDASKPVGLDAMRQPCKLSVSEQLAPPREIVDKLGFKGDLHRRHLLIHSWKNPVFANVSKLALRYIR